MNALAVIALLATGISAVGGWLVYARQNKIHWVWRIVNGLVVLFVAEIAAVMMLSSWLVPAEDKPTPMPVAAKEAKKAAYGPGLGLTYGQVMQHLDTVFPEMQDAPLDTGEARKMGQSDPAKAMVTLEVVGDLPGKVDRASLSMVAVTDNASVNAGNSLVAAAFLRNTLPEWPDSMKWATEAVNGLARKSAKEGRATMETVRGDKKLKISAFKSLGMFTFTVSHHEAKN